MKRHGPWRTLELDPTEDRSAIRRAYADKLRGLDPDKDIEGFARLRQARDYALMLAKGLAEAQAEADDFDDDDFAEADLESAYPAADGEVLERLEVADRPATDSPAEPAPPQVLLSILYPDGETSEQALTAEEWKIAQAALGAILQEAAASSIDAQAAIDGWLAHHLASTWPRSAWLLEPTAEAFGWMDESGRLTERPAVQFLNLRLRGLRFVARVEQPAHPLHKAWTELSKPGPKTALSFLRAGKADVRHLLSGIRERYPEVESYLDPQRVASWEASTQSTPWTPWKVALRIIIGLYLLALLYGAIVGPRNESRAPEATAQATEQLDALVTEIFGERPSDATLRADAPIFKPIIEGLSSGRSTLKPEAPGLLLQRIRWMTLAAAREADFEELVAIKQIKLDLLRAAREQSAATCKAYARGGLFPPELHVGENLRVRERALAARLLRAGRLRVETAGPSGTYSIPAKVVTTVMSRSGLSDEAFREAAHEKGTDANLCAYDIAILEVVLRRPGEVPADLLRLL